jgi:rhodanese-related sulfurtransferase
MPEAIDRTKLQHLVDGGAQVVEVLPAGDYDEEHLPGAVNIPLRHLAERAPTELDQRRPVIVYCYDSL